MRDWMTAALLLLPILPGCSTPPPAPIAVQGRVVRADGKPLTRMVVTFYPREDQKKVKVSTAAVDEKTGEFQVDCVPGNYKVTLAPMPTQHGSAADAGDVGKTPGTPGSNSIPNKYLSADSSPWAVTVVPGNTEPVVLKLE